MVTFDSFDKKARMVSFNVNGKIVSRQLNDTTDDSSLDQNIIDLATGLEIEAGVAAQKVSPEILGDVSFKKGEEIKAIDEEVKE